MINSIKSFFFLAAFLISGLSILSGILLFSNQVVQFVNLGVWVKVPATVLFVDSPEETAHLLTQLHVMKAGEQQPQESQQTIDAGRQILAYGNIYSTIPDWFKSNDSWLAQPGQLIGLNRIIRWFLDVISLPMFAIFNGIFMGAIALAFGINSRILIEKGQTKVGDNQPD